MRANRVAQDIARFVASREQQEFTTAEVAQACPGLKPASIRARLHWLVKTERLDARPSGYRRDLIYRERLDLIAQLDARPRLDPLAMAFYRMAKQSKLKKETNENLSTNSRDAGPEKKDEGSAKANGYFLPAGQVGLNGPLEGGHHKWIQRILKRAKECARRGGFKLGPV